MKTVSSRSYNRVLRFAQETPWMVLPEKMDAIAEVLSLRAAGHAFTEDEIRERLGTEQVEHTQAFALESPIATSAGGDGRGIGVIPIRGTILPRLSGLESMSGGASLETLSEQLDAMLANPAIGSIVLDIDSPGGSVAGVPEFAKKVYEARSVKPILAVADHLAASAAYYIASAATEFYVAPSGMTGSVGAMTLHIDQSKALEQKGIKATVIRAPGNKVEANPYEPLSKEAKARIQASIDKVALQFQTDVAKYRGVSLEKVQADFGNGLVFDAEDAEDAMMSDGVATFDDVVKLAAVAALTEDNKLRFIASAINDEIAADLAAVAQADLPCAETVTALAEAVPADTTSATTGGEGEDVDLKETLKALGLASETIEDAKAEIEHLQFETGAAAYQECGEEIAALKVENRVAKAEIAGRVNDQNRSFVTKLAANEELFNEFMAAPFMGIEKKNDKPAGVVEVGAPATTEPTGKLRLNIPVNPDEEARTNRALKLAEDEKITFHEAYARELKAEGRA